MSGPVVAILVALALGVVVVRRRSLATLIVAVQSLLLGIAAIAASEGYSTELVIAGIALIIRAGTLPALLAFARHRTPEPRFVAAAAPAALRLVVAVVVALAAVALAPPLGLGDRAAEQGAIALVVLGIAIVALRRPTLFQALGLLVAENGVYVLALSVPGGLPAAIELGVLFDLVIVLTVVAAFSYMIHREVGSGNTELLRGLRD
jgi:hydrogenase-4 component E